MAYRAGIIVAITDLKDRTGSSSVAIKKHMQARLSVDKKWLNKSFLTALKKAVDDGDLVQSKFSYKLSADYKKKSASVPGPRKKAAPKKKSALEKKKKKETTKKKALVESHVLRYTFRRAITSYGDGTYTDCRASEMEAAEEHVDGELNYTDSGEKDLGNDLRNAGEVNNKISGIVKTLIEDYLEYIKKGDVEVVEAASPGKKQDQIVRTTDAAGFHRWTWGFNYDGDEDDYDCELECSGSIEIVTKTSGGGEMAPKKKAAPKKNTTTKKEVATKKKTPTKKKTVIQKNPTTKKKITTKKKAK